MSFYYLDVSLEANTTVDDEHFLAHVKCCIKALLGETGAGVPIDLLKFNPAQTRAILRCPASFFIKLQTSLTTCGYYNNHPARFITHRTSPCLLNLLSVN
ncbi:hypothetical protein M8J77_018996 [Diaphorina citri]|nr:hypothetical protein M8J77_018996 [Diaphorina citri]